MEKGKCTVCGSSKIIWTRSHGVRVWKCESCRKVAAEKGSLFDLAFKTASEI